MRTSVRKGFRPNYTAENLSFRCAQSMNEDTKLDQDHEVIRLRPPVHHHSNEPHEHSYHNDEL